MKCCILNSKYFTRTTSNVKKKKKKKHHYSSVSRKNTKSTPKANNEIINHRKVLRFRRTRYYVVRLWITFVGFFHFLFIFLFFFIFFFFININIRKAVLFTRKRGFSRRKKYVRLSTRIKHVTFFFFLFFSLRPFAGPSQIRI